MRFNSEECRYLAGVLLNHISHYDGNVPDYILEDDLRIYNKLSGEELDIDYARKYIINKG